MTAITTSIADIIKAVMMPDLQVRSDADKFWDPGAIQDINEEIVREALNAGLLTPDTIDPQSGLPILHLAIGRDRYKIARLLIERGATFGPDRYGRWPSTIAAVCEASEWLGDFVVEAEAAWLSANGGIPE